MGMINLKIKKCLHWVSCRKFNFNELLFEAFYDIIGTFSSVQPQSACTSPFQCIILKMATLWCPPAPFLEEIKTCTLRVFCGKFNFIQFLFESLFIKINDFYSKIMIPFLTHLNLYITYFGTEIFPTFIIANVVADLITR